MFGQQHGIQGLLKEGGKHFAGVDEALLKNIKACREFAGITMTSVGPTGTSKLIINHIGKHFVTSDCGTIVKELEVQHPAAKMLVMAAESQERECGDGTNLVITFAGALLKEAEDLLKQGLHAADIIKGYEMAAEKCLQFLDDYENMGCWEAKNLREIDCLSKALRTSISSKQLGYDTQLASLVAKAAVRVIPQNPKDFDVDSVRVAKIPGASLEKSEVVDGMIVTRDASGVHKKKNKSKVAVYGGGIESQQTETKGTVLLSNAEQLLNFTKGDESKMEQFVKSVKDAGVEVLISGGHVSDIALHFLNKYEIMVIKIQSKFELRRICRTLGATAIIRAGPPMAEECGFAEICEVREIASQKVIVLKASDSKVSTLLLRGATANMLEEWERAVDDGVNVVRSCAKDNRFVAGGGACEISLAAKLTQYGATVRGLDQYAVLKFAEALEIIPKLLAENSGHSRTEAITALYAAHESGNKFMGVNVDEGSTMGVNLEEGSNRILIDVAKEGILDHLMTKRWALRFAVDAVLTVLRVDQIIMSKQAGGPKGGDGGNADDD